MRIVLLVFLAFTNTNGIYWPIYDIKRSAKANKSSKILMFQMNVSLYHRFFEFGGASLDSYGTSRCIYIIASENVIEYLLYPGLETILSHFIECLKYFII